MKLSKKILSIVLAVALVLGTVAVAANAETALPQCLTLRPATHSTLKFIWKPTIMSVPQVVNLSSGTTTSSMQLRRRMLFPQASQQVGIHLHLQALQHQV